MDNCFFDPSGFVCGIERSAVGRWVTGELTGNFSVYPITLTIHGIGMMIVMGVVVVFCLRVLGFAQGISVSSYNKLFQAAWAGFILNLFSGLLLLTGFFSTYLYQWAFQLKIAMILVGGILLKVVMNAIRSNRDEKTVRLLSAACLAAWIIAILGGRLMAYT